MKLAWQWATSCQRGGLSTAPHRARCQQALAVDPSATGASWREAQGGAEITSVLSQGNDSPGPGAHEMGNFGQGGYKMSLT